MQTSKLSWRMLAWLFTLQLLIALVGRSLAPLGPLIGQDLYLTKAQIGLLPAAFFLGQVIVSIPAGFITDKIGTKYMLLIVTIALGGSFFIVSFISVFSGVIFMIALGGMGYGAFQPASNRGIIYWFSLKNRGTAMGIKQMGVTVGSALSALLLLPLATTFDWRLSVKISSLLLLVFGFITFLAFKESRQSSKALALGKMDSFLLQFKRLIKHKPLLLLNLAAMLLNGIQVIFNTYIILFAHEILKFSLVSSGLFLVTAEIGGSFGRVGWGLISDRLLKSKRLIVMIIISIMIFIMLILFSFLSPQISFLKMVLLTFIFGFCVSGFNGIWMNAVTESVTAAQAGIGSGLSSTIGASGPILIPPIFGLIIDVTGSYTKGWLSLSVLMIFVLFILTFAIKIRERTGN